MASSPNLPPLTRPDDHLTQEDIDDFYNRFSRDISFNLPPALVFDNLCSIIRLLYSNIILRQRDQLTAIFQQERDQLTAGFQQERDQLTAGFQHERTRMLAGFQGEREQIVASCKAERDVMLATFENERHLWATQLDAANNAVQQSNALVEQSGNRLNEYLLRAPISNAPPVIGSQTRAANWVKLTRHPGFREDLKLPADPVTTDLMQLVLADVPLLVNTYDFKHEREMYPLFCDLLNTGLNLNGDHLVSVFDTSRMPYLGGYMPDISMMLPGTIEPDSSSLCIVVDMKLRTTKEHKRLGTHDDFGQILDYLLVMREAQKGRRICVALLSDVDRNYVVTLAAEGCVPYLVRYASDTIFAALAYMYDIALKEVSHRPPGLGFSKELGQIRRRLGNPRLCTVGEFYIPNTTTGAIMAVKRTVNKTREPVFLRLFAKDGNKPDSIPSMVYNMDDIEFGITPVGMPLVPGMFVSALQIRRIINDVVTAAAWLHTKRIIHRDIRCENIILVNSGAVLIDFDAAYLLDWPLPTIFRGGYICIPPVLLKGVLDHGMEHTYFPSPADDCFAVLLLAHCLLFPNRFADFRSCEVGVKGSEESGAVLRFWEDLDNSRVWKHFKDLAEKGDMTAMAELTDLFY